jgi:hypothetical protein
MTDRIPVSSLVTYSAPAGTGATWHNAPQPYICNVLSGKGHITRAITDLHVALINRAGV